jgi:hypothetical protein
MKNTRLLVKFSEASIFALVKLYFSCSKLCEKIVMKNRKTCSNFLDKTTCSGLSFKTHLLPQETFLSTSTLFERLLSSAHLGVLKKTPG